MEAKTKSFGKKWFKVSNIETSHKIWTKKCPLDYVYDA